MHEVPGVLLLLRCGLRRKVRGDGVEERPGLVPELHPVRRTRVILSYSFGLDLLHLRLGLSSRTSLHEVLEVAAGSAGPAIHLLRHAQENSDHANGVQTSDWEYDEINSASIPRYMLEKGNMKITKYPLYSLLY